jgi:hypothetical protein
MDFHEAEYRDGAIRARRGRPSKFNLRLAEKICFLAEKGLTESEISYVFDIHQDTLNSWKQSEQFSVSLRMAKQKADEPIEAALRQRALGMTLQSITITVDKETGRVRHTTVIKQIAPSVRAIILWLANRSPDRWRFLSGHFAEWQQSLRERQLIYEQSKRGEY